MGQITEEEFRVRGMFFSGTGTTERIVKAVSDGITSSSDIIRREADLDFTPPRARDQAYRFRPEDILVFGVPVIAGRVPNVLLPFLNTLEGGGAMAIPVVLYGNRNFDDALIELRNILEERGFHTVAAAAFIGEHSFSRVLAAGRPDEQDLQIAADFAKAAAARIEELPQPLHDLKPIQVDGEDPIRPYYKPRDRQGNHINILKVKPKLDPAKCTKCGICVAACPMGSIKPEAPGVVDGICIKCCGCEKKCPEEALYFDDQGYLYHKTELELGYPDRKEPKLFV
ncbi:MAG: 4Fe-4S binding protein [Firmicutes bacterium]|nr:4Fe-4S binding protein [Bacillota bacterium]